MTLDVEIGGRRRRVRARRVGTGWTVAVDGREFYVDVAAAGSRCSLLVAPGPDDPRWYTSHEIAIEARGRGARLVHVDGLAVPVAPAGALAAGTAAVAAAGGGPARITAPMPGRIVRVLVEAGQAVAAGQGLVVVEAMKMENEVRAPRSGTVGDVRIREGMSIEASTILMTLE